MFNSQSLLQVGGRWSEYKQTLDSPFQVTTDDMQVSTVQQSQTLGKHMKRTDS